MAQGQQGTGRHPQKKGGGSGSQNKSGGRENQRSMSSDDLKSREYKDPNGQIHHHTRSYMEQHGKDGSRGR